MHAQFASSSCEQAISFFVESKFSVQITDISPTRAAVVAVWVWLWTNGDSIQNKRQNPQSKLFACVWLCNWNCIYWEEACDSFLSFRSFMYNQWRKMFLYSGDFDTSFVRPTITSSELILTVVVSWQPITDVLHVESNQKIVCEFAFVWSKCRFMSTVS